MAGIPRLMYWRFSSSMKVVLPVMSPSWRISFSRRSSLRSPTAACMLTERVDL